MSHLYCMKKRRKGKHLNYEERQILEKIIKKTENCQTLAKELKKK